MLSTSYIIGSHNACPRATPIWARFHDRTLLWLNLTASNLVGRSIDWLRWTSTLSKDSCSSPVDHRLSLRINIALADPGGTTARWITSYADCRTNAPCRRYTCTLRVILRCQSIQHARNSPLCSRARNYSLLSNHVSCAYRHSPLSFCLALCLHFPFPPQLLDSGDSKRKTADNGLSRWTVPFLFS